MNINNGDNGEGNMTKERYICLIGYFLLHYISSENIARIYRIVQKEAMDEVKRGGGKNINLTSEEFPQGI